MNEVYEIRSEYGDRYSYRPRSYDMACRVAYYMRKIAQWDGIGVVSATTGRYISEVHDPDTNKDHYARNVARRLLT